jgi:hypothetical protein
MQTDVNNAIKTFSSRIMSVLTAAVSDSLKSSKLANHAQSIIAMSVTLETSEDAKNVSTEHSFIITFATRSALLELSLILRTELASLADTTVPSAKIKILALDALLEKFSKERNANPSAMMALYQLMEFVLLAKT